MFEAPPCSALCSALNRMEDIIVWRRRVQQMAAQRDPSHRLLNACSMNHAFYWPAITKLC